ncbi:sulfurtransferase complex subunit TusD [Alteromonas pelagimontana]|uniref:Sulfurtransferase complex subunit TusD n=1 Tax=Alteromonas pelagimontana TaxID=1858656 RepID=A0A6M4MB02_9ALTE|nr:sulfurtransferase complex subunit TusD [Alteromonas pelagimontana]QJR79336.1 sulfurtransferase complex subunit TusD [Alteromonas pelagimontana]
MATYSVLVTTSPFDSSNARRAISFCTSAIELGDKIQQIFFYQAGVYHANALINPTNDEYNPYFQWCEIHQSAATRLWVCVTAAAKRGIMSKHEAAIAEKTQHNVVFPFEQVGLGEFFTELHQCDRLVQF